MLYNVVHDSDSVQSTAAIVGLPWNTWIIWIKFCKLYAVPYKQLLEALELGTFSCYIYLVSRFRKQKQKKKQHQNKLLEKEVIEL